MGLVVLADQVGRIMQWHAFHSADGLASRELSQEWEGGFVWSVYWLFEHEAWPYIIEVVRTIATVLLIIGVQCRLMALTVFIIVSSAVNYNPIILHGGDRVLMAMLFFSMFLPVGGRYSLEALWHGQDERRTIRSVGSAAYMLQVLLVFWVAGILKTGPAWTSDYTAISQALHLEVFASDFARLWRHIDPLTQMLTFVVIWIEWLAPVLALVPWLIARSVGVGALLILEIGIWMNLEIGVFPFISVVSLLPLVPGAWLDAVSRREKNEGSGWVLYYDKNCRFCTFACRLLQALCGFTRAGLRPAQSDPGAYRILKESGSWCLRQAKDTTYTKGWKAVRMMLEAGGQKSLARYLPESARGEQWYEWIGRHRNAFGYVGKAVFGKTKWRITGILDAADALRAKRREALAQLDTLLQSTFLDMFGDQRELREMQWGEIPEWARNQPGARRLINARSETVHEKASFKGSFRQRRCVIPVNGWFEWRPEKDGKQPYWIRPEGAELFSLAGIWEPGSGTPGSRATFVILTTAAASGIADIHHRQPLILEDEAIEAWLKPGWAPNGLMDVVLADGERAYERRRVSRDVASPRNDSPELLEPLMAMASTGGTGEVQVALQ